LQADTTGRFSFFYAEVSTPTITTATADELLIAFCVVEDIGADTYTQWPLTNFGTYEAYKYGGEDDLSIIECNDNAGIVDGAQQYPSEPAGPYSVKWTNVGAEGYNVLTGIIAYTGSGGSGGGGGAGGGGGSAPPTGCNTLGFTTHDQDITYDAGNGDGPILYRGSTGMANTAKEGNSDLGVDNLEVTAFLESDSITEADIRAGLYDNAEVTVRVVNWADLSMGDVVLMHGYTGNVKMKNGLFTAELRGLSQKLTTVVGATYGEICRADLGSNASNSTSRWLCNVDLDAYRQAGNVASVTDDRTIVPASGLLNVGASPQVAAPAGWFNDGIITWTSGVLKCSTSEIKSWDGTTLVLFLSLSQLPSPGDTFIIEPGCNKSTDCQAKFANIVNFRAEPFIPGMDQLLDYAS
jgi:uncharacterized phage protein (TIGR02218 family)